MLIRTMGRPPPLDNGNNPMGAGGPSTWPLLALILSAVFAALVDSQGYRISQTHDSYPWEPCNSFESTKKNCPRGETCLKLKAYKEYAWNWAMRCQSREEYIEKFEFNLFN